MTSCEHPVADWLTIIRGEFVEMPGLRLTKPQVQRLWGLDPTTCDALLAVLESAHFLRRTQDNAYVKADVGR
jgi:hypothetical protein